MQCFTYDESLFCLQLVVIFHLRLVVILPTIGLYFAYDWSLFYLWWVVILPMMGCYFTYDGSLFYLRWVVMSCTTGNKHSMIGGIDRCAAVGIAWKTSSKLVLFKCYKRKGNIKTLYLFITSSCIYLYLKFIYWYRKGRLWHSLRYKLKGINIESNLPQW